MFVHYITSSYLVEDTMNKVRKGVPKPIAAAEKSDRLSVCGIFNRERSREIFEKLASVH